MESTADENEENSKTSQIVLQANDHDCETNHFRFEPPLYIQRYDYVAAILKKYECSTYIDIGCSNCKLLQYLKNSSDSLNLMVGLDVDDDVLKRGKEYLAASWFDYIKPRANSLEIYLIKGDISEPSDYLINQIGYQNTDLDCVSMVEVIEHMYPEVLEKAMDTVFNKLKPKIVILTTPNSDFNIVFQDMDKVNNETTEDKPKFRHWDHKFEWTRYEFQTWCQSLLQKYSEYELVCYDGRGVGPDTYTDIGFCSQIALFTKKQKTVSGQPQEPVQFKKYLSKKNQLNFVNRLQRQRGEGPVVTEPYINCELFEAACKEEIYACVQYPFELFEFENDESRNKALFDELDYMIRFMVKPSNVKDDKAYCFDDEDQPLTEEDSEKIENEIDLHSCDVYLCPVEKLFSFPSIEKFNLSAEDLINVMKNKYEFTKSMKYVIYRYIYDSSDSYYSTESGYQNGDLEEEDSYDSYCAKNTGFSEEDWDEEIEVKAERVFTPEEQFGDDAHPIIFPSVGPATLDEHLAINKASLDSTISTHSSDSSFEFNGSEVNYFASEAKKLAEHFKSIKKNVRREERRKLRKEVANESKHSEQFSSD